MRLLHKASERGFSMDAQTGIVAGGTGLFAAASGSYVGTVTARGLAARNPDGSRSMEQTALHEVDRLASTGSLSF
jgi:hypothetical protein